MSRVGISPSLPFGETARSPAWIAERSPQSPKTRRLDPTKRPTARKLPAGFSWGGLLFEAKSDVSTRFDDPLQAATKQARSLGLHPGRTHIPAGSWYVYSQALEDPTVHRTKSLRSPSAEGEAVAGCSLSEYESTKRQAVVLLSCLPSHLLLLPLRKLQETASILTRPGSPSLVHQTRRSIHNRSCDSGKE
jgi:hypothetical protein